MATQMPVAPSSRQPFAPLNQSRLQTLCSLKNRQNAISSPSKRKASAYDHDIDDSENVDPTFSTSPKRSKALDGTTTVNPIFKPSQFILTSAPPSPNDQPSVFKTSSLISPAKVRPILSARSPLKTNIAKTPLSAPAGRSPTKKRIGISNRRRTGSSPNGFTRIDPPAFNGGNPGARGGLPFTIDAALKGTISSYGRRNTTSSTPRPAPSTSSSEPSAPMPPPDMSAIPQLYTAAPKSSWFFEIHEDTIEEENTNLMYHSTCILDISSDEESTSRIRDLRGKENVPPMDDQSQTSYRPSSYQQQQESAGTALKNRISRKEKDIDACDVDRSPLGEMRAEDFYEDGYDANSCYVFLDDVYEEAPADEEFDEAAYQAAAASLLKSQSTSLGSSNFDFSTVPQIRVEEEVEVKGKGKSVEDLLKIDRSVPGLPAAVLQPIEKAEEGWKIWESGSVSGGE